MIYIIKNKAFTLIELLVVIAIIGLLASIVIVNLTGTRGKANIARGLQFSQSIHHNLGAYAVGVWSFDDVDDPSQAIDTSGYGNHGTIHGANYTTETPSGQGYALSFDGNDYVGIPNSSSLNPGADMTMIAWIYWRGGSGDHNIITKESAYEFRVNNNYINYATNPWAWRGGTSAPILTGEWHHIVITHKGDGLQKIYIDGGEKYSASSGGNIVINNNIVTIGARYGGTASFFNGLIDGVHIYEKALKTSQIESLYYAGLDRLLEKGLISEQEYQERL